MRRQWFQRRWWEFRHGDSMYLRFTMSFVQFILLTYTLGIERFPILEGVFSHLWLYAVTFLLVYPPLAVTIGHLHRKKQITTETIINIEQNQLGAYSTYLNIEQIITLMEVNGVTVPDDYLELRDFWKSLAKEWKPPRRS